MEIQMQAVSRLKLEHKKEYKTPKLKSCDFLLDVKKPLDLSQYLNDEQLPNAAGLHAIANCFIQGLVGVIHTAHKNGYKKDTEYIKYIIEEISRGFAENVEVTKSIYRQK